MTGTKSGRRAAAAAAAASVESWEVAAGRRDVGDGAVRACSVADGQEGAQWEALREGNMMYGG